MTARPVRRAGRRSARTWGLAATAAFALSCTNASLQPPDEPPPPPADNKFAVSGTVCTDEPVPLEFPLRVLFIADVSQSMNVTDPAPLVCGGVGMCFTRRAQAVLDVLNAYPGGNGVEYALETFSSASNTITADSTGADGFTDDDNMVKTRLPVLNTATGQTNYEGALAEAFTLLQRDMSRLDATQRARARYIIIFLSDGLPSPVTADANTPERIINKVKAIADLQRVQRLEEITFHTVYLAGPTTPLDARLQAQELLADMAREGGGTTRTFEANEQISFFYLDFRSFLRVFGLKSLIASDTNVHSVNTFPMVDSDGDGLLDVDEVEPGTDPMNPDTDGDGWSDLLEVRLRSAGFDPLFPGDADCALADDKNDDDGDGLRNCEERFLGTSSRLIDSDGDGISDDLEFLQGSNPVADDILTDTDLDGARNGSEVAAHTDPQANDSADFSRIAYRYDISQEHDNAVPPGRSCYQFQIDNITLAEPKATGTLAEGTNTILIRSVSAPKDAPNDLGNHRIACVRPRYREAADIKQPPSGHMVLRAEDFKLPAGDPADPEVFDADRDCVVP